MTNARHGYRFFEKLFSPRANRKKLRPIVVIPVGQASLLEDQLGLIIALCLDGGGMTTQGKNQLLLGYVVCYTACNE
jgi:hypothetical protein